mgnify:CR=1 FL=1
MAKKRQKKRKNARARKSHKQTRGESAASVALTVHREAEDRLVHSERNQRNEEVCRLRNYVGGTVFTA